MAGSAPSGVVWVATADEQDDAARARRDATRTAYATRPRASAYTVADALPGSALRIARQRPFWAG